MKQLDNTLIKILDKAIENIDYKRVIGAIVFGSYVKGRIDELSDIDIAVITNDTGEVHKYFQYNGIDIDLLLIPKKFFEEVLEEVDNRSNYTLWLTHTLYLKILKEGMIIHDTLNTLNTWIEYMGKWKWTKRDLEQAINHLYIILDKALELFDENMFFEAFLALRDSINQLPIIYELKNNVIPSPKAKDIYLAAGKYRLINKYIEIHGLKNIDNSLIKQVMGKASIVDNIYIRRNIKKIMRELIRGNNQVALLEARNLYLSIIDPKHRSFERLDSIFNKISFIQEIPIEERCFIEKLYGIDYMDNTKFREYIDYILKKIPR